jgi:hypothetical protein
LGADSRAIDDALQQLLATAQPLTWYPSARIVSLRLALIIATADSARRLAFAADRAGTLDERAAHGLGESLEDQLTTIGSVRSAVRGEHAGTLKPIVQRLARIDRHLSEQGVDHTDPRPRMLLATALLDERLLELGENFRLAISDGTTTNKIRPPSQAEPPAFPPPRPERRSGTRRFTRRAPRALPLKGWHGPR